MKLSSLLILLAAGGILFAIFYKKSPGNLPAAVAPSAANSRTLPAGYMPGGSGYRAVPAMPTDIPGPSGASSGSSPSLLDSAISFIKSHTPSMPSLPGHHSSFKLADLRIARCALVEQHDQKLYVNCRPWTVRQPGDATIYAGDGWGRSAMYGSVPRAEELGFFGQLKAVVNGNLVPSPYNEHIWQPASYFDGRVIIENCPPITAKYFKIVVVQESTTLWDGESVPLVTPTFHLEDEPKEGPGSWMWQASGQGTLDKPAKPR